MAYSASSLPCLQLAMGMVVNFFFSGFVLGKVPFALSPRFKLMLQVRASTRCSAALFSNE